MSKKVLRGILCGFFLLSYGIANVPVESANLVWFVTDEEERENVEKLLQQFEKSHATKNGKLQVTFEHDQHYQTRVQEILQDHPDVITLQNGYVSRGLMKSGLLQDLQELWEKNNLDLQYSSAIHSVSLGSRFYGLPISYQDPIVFLYRKSLAKKYKIRSFPKTWETFQKSCQGLLDAEQIPVMTGLSDEQGGWMWVQALLPGVLSYSELLSLMTSVEKPSDRMVEILDILDVCRNSNFFNKDSAKISFKEALYKFIEQKEGVFFLSKRSALENFSIESQQDIGYFFLPAWGEGNSTTAFMSTKSLFCSKTGYQKQVVRDFLRFISQKRTIKKLNKGLFYKMTPQNLSIFSIFEWWNPDRQKEYFFKKTKRYFINDLKKELPESFYQSMRIFVLRNVLQKTGIVPRTLDAEWKHHVPSHKQ